MRCKTAMKERLGMAFGVLLLVAAPALADTVVPTLTASVPTRAVDVPARAADVVAEVLSRNPHLAAIGAKVAAAGHAAIRAGTLPDPTFSVGLSNYPFSTRQTPMSGVQFDLQQRIPWLSKLAALEAAAKEDQRIDALLRIETTNVLRARAWRLLWELAFLKEHRHQALLIRGTLIYLAGVTRATYAVGKGQQQDLIKPVLEAHRIDELVVGIDRQSQIVLSELNAMRHRDPGAPVVPPPIPGGAAQAQALTRRLLRAYAVKHNPLLKLRKVVIAREGELLRAAKLDYIPDFTVGLQYRARWANPNTDPVGGADFFGVTLGVNLPVYARTKQGERVKEVDAELRRAGFNLGDMQDRVRDMIERFSRAVERDREQAKILRKQVIPDTEKALESSLSDYQLGRIEFLSVLDNLMDLFRAKVDLARLVTRTRASMARLEHWLGGPLNNALKTTFSGGKKHER